jgi:cadmium resistance protein CadD (predicted permease)
VRTIVGVVVVASLAFLGTMVDNYFAFAAQLVVTERRRFRRVGLSQAVGVLVLAGLAAGLGSLLAPIPLRWVGLLCVAPFAFAVHAWRHRSAPREQFRRGAVTTFAMTLALGGDNVAVWIPLLRANRAAHAALAVLVFAAWDAIFVLSAQRLASHPRVVAWGEAHAPGAMPYLYVFLGALILVECHTF